jgi:hypothetical protein
MTMRDLKDLLEPLGDRPMPDRWESIQHRPVRPMPEPHRSRLGAGIAAVAIALLAIGVIVWLLPLQGTGNEPGSSTSPQPSRYVSPQGWTVSVPPGWTTQEFSVHEQGGAMQGTVIANQAVGAPVLDQFALPRIPADRFPSDAVALVVGDVSGSTEGAMPPVRPPLAYSDFREVASGGDSSLRILTFEGPRQLFFATTQVGVDASAADMDALRATIAGLAFTDEAATLPSPSGTPGLPTPNSVIDDRFVTDVVLDDGAFSVQPAPVDTVPVLPKAAAEQLLLASPLFRDTIEGVVGFGLVTSQVNQNGVPTFRSDPAWVAFGWDTGTSSCKAEAPTPTVTNGDLPSGGYVAVALIEGAGGGDISYEAQSAPCGQVQGPFVAPATHVESVAWEQAGAIVNNEAYVKYVPAPCGTEDSLHTERDNGLLIVTIEMTVPDAASSCPSLAPRTTRVSSSSSPKITGLEHPPTGILQQARF